MNFIANNHILGNIIKSIVKNLSLNLSLRKSYFYKVAVGLS